MPGGVVYSLTFAIHAIVNALCAVEPSATAAAADADAAVVVVLCS